MGATFSSVMSGIGNTIAQAAAGFTQGGWAGAVMGGLGGALTTDWDNSGSTAVSQVSGGVNSSASIQNQQLVSSVNKISKISGLPLDYPVLP